MGDISDMKGTCIVFADTMVRLSTSLLLASIVSLTVRGEFDLMAFTLGQDDHLELTNATIINFSKEITNHKTHDLVSGVFTCRYPGLYKFQAYSLTRTDKNVYMHVYKNDDVIASLWAHTPLDYAAAGNAVILDLVNGDTVKVISETNQPVSMYGKFANIYTTFSGVQLGAYQSDSDAQLCAVSVGLVHVQSVTGGYPVLYDRIYVDTEYAYNVNSGVFTAPNGGIYQIHFFGLAYKDKLIWLELYHNADYVCSIYGLTVDEWAGAGNTAILHLHAGDQLQVRARTNNNNTLHGGPGEIYTTFTAHELYTGKTITTTRDGPKSYFSVGLAVPLSVSDGSKVVFDRVFTDLGGDYDHVTGEYVAPEFGTYEFNYHALGENTTAVALDMYHNYRYVNSLYSHTPSDYGSAGNSAVLELDRGDVVYIRAFGDNSLYGRRDEVYTTFSGALLHSSSAKHPPVIGK